MSESAEAVRVVVVDYGMGNLRSVEKMASRCGAEVRIASDPEALDWGDKLILPGVGAFADAMDELQARRLIDPLHRLVIDKRKPILGICLGMELMASKSEEGRGVSGLAWLDAEMVSFDTEKGIRVPHVGWNTVHVKRDSGLFHDVENEAAFYFVHSYHMVCRHEENVVATTEYGGQFNASVARENIWGAQFHPEKSQVNGSIALANFILGEQS